ncbi:hypothetical protein BT69DRAFT_327339 [Atractiella rhizophila]|nr:hypothetical protein BT69DRAFT_327339 [Atractiella rhizophila]
MGRCSSRIFTLCECFRIYSMVLWAWKSFSRTLVWFESVAVPWRGDLKLEEEVTRFLSISIRFCLALNV